MFTSTGDGLPFRILEKSTDMFARDTSFSGPELDDLFAEHTNALGPYLRQRGRMHRPKRPRVAISIREIPAHPGPSQPVLGRG